MSGVDPVVRRARPADADEAARLWLALQKAQGAWHPAFAPSDDAALRWANDFSAWIRADAVRRVLVAELEEKVVGLATAEPWFPPPIYRDAREVFLTGLYVDPEARRRGVGRALVEAVRAWGRELDATRMRVRLVAGNAEAEAFWTAVGAEPLSRTLELEP